MVSEAQEGSANSGNPLQQAGILQRVLDYVGPGHWCCVAEVSSLWREVYMTVATAEMLMIFGYHTITCVPQMTTLSAVFGSASRVQLADAHQRSSATNQYQRAAGMYADVATLEAARKAGMRYTSDTMRGAARCNTLAAVQFLRAQGCPWDAGVFSAAAARGDTDMCAYLHAEHCPWNGAVCYQAALNGHASTLRWLHEHGCPLMVDHVDPPAAQSGSVEVLVYLQQQRQGASFTTDQLTEMLNIAGAHNKLAAAQWLKQQGAEWPAVLSYGEPWSGDVLSWARAEGCTAPTHWG
jgi:hypothetical protein